MLGNIHQFTLIHYSLNLLKHSFQCGSNLKTIPMPSWRVVITQHCERHPHNNFVWAGAWKLKPSGVYCTVMSHNIGQTVQQHGPFPSHKDPKIQSSTSDQSNRALTVKTTLYMNQVLSGIYANHTQNTWLSSGISLISTPCLKNSFKSYCTVSMETKAKEYFLLFLSVKIPSYLSCQLSLGDPEGLKEAVISMLLSITCHLIILETYLPFHMRRIFYSSTFLIRWKQIV